MVYYNKILKECVEAINKCVDKNYTDITVKRIRKCNDIPSSDRSRIHFISRALEDLKTQGHLQLIGRNSPKVYKILNKISFKSVKDQSK
ncbi:MAG: hypothetical protein JW776_08070 [Candidatus Lokiarchaeota archaeon]|nr:hypothetical protein [Candidatus Lokiarchaeota archaeon]